MKACQLIVFLIVGYVFFNRLFNERWKEAQREKTAALKMAFKHRPLWLHIVLFVSLGNMLFWMCQNPGSEENQKQQTGVVMAATMDSSFNNYQWVETRRQYSYYLFTAVLIFVAIYDYFTKRKLRAQGLLEKEYKYKLSHYF